MSLNFESFTQQGQEFVNKVAFALGNMDDKEHAARVVTAFFHALRERISPEESLHFISQLPMYLKAVYVDGWKLSKRVNSADTLADFLNVIRAQCGVTAARDLGNDETAARTVRQVVHVIREYVSQGELDHLSAQLPEGIAEIFQRIEVL